MMEKCFDEAILQAFLDNELPNVKSQTVARHIAACDSCAILLAEVEEETAFAFTALEQEFNTLVPTQRLWTKINESIETQSRNRSVWHKFSAFVSGLNLMNPQIVAFGSLLLIVGVISALILIKNENVSSDAVAVTLPVTVNKKNETVKIEPNNPTVTTPPNIEQVKEIKPRNITNPQVRVEKAGNRRLFRGGLRGLQPRRSVGDQWIRSASVIPETRPLRPISHWRSALSVMLMTKTFRRCDRLAAVRQLERRRAGFDRSDARHPRRSR